MDWRMNGQMRQLTCAWHICCPSIPVSQNDTEVCASHMVPKAAMLATHTLNVE